MTAPESAAIRLAAALALGFGLGLAYDFLTPLRRRRSALPDAVFVALTWWAWLWWGFGLCAGDLRLGGLAGMALGFFLWRSLTGRRFVSVFAEFWGIVSKILRWPLQKAKKSFLFLKKIFASWRKWVTIKWSSCIRRKPPWQNPR